MLTWDASLETGIVEIDDQHRLLFARARAVLEAVEAGGGHGEVRRTLEFLLDYAAEHFALEERYMALAAYPAAAAHAQEHRELTGRLQAAAAAYDAGGASGPLVADVEALVRGWLADHVRRTDRAMATYLAITGAGAG